MARNPYKSDEIGPTFTTVREKISKDTNMALDVVELMVADKIIENDVNITDVFEKIFWPDYAEKKKIQHNLFDIEVSELPYMTIT